MKIMHRLLLLFAIAFMLFGTSCEDNNLPKKKLVKTITYISSHSRGQSLFEYNTQGRLSKITIHWNVLDRGYTTKGTVKYTYSRNKIFVNTIDYFESCKIYTLNNLGYVESSIREEPDREPDLFFYNDGYIQRFEYNYNIKFEYTWISGNITEINSQDDDISVPSQKITCSYSNIMNNPNCNLDFNHLILPMSIFYDDDQILAMTGYIGKRSTHLISSYVWEWSQYDDVNVTNHSLKFTFDSDGFVTSIALDDRGINKYLIEYY